MRVETSLILVSNLFYFVEQWRKPVIFIQLSELILTFHHRGKKLFFRHEVSLLKCASKGKTGEKKNKEKIKRRRRKNLKKKKSQVESFGTKAENLSTGLMDWRIPTWKKVMLAKISNYLINDMQLNPFVLFLQQWQNIFI